MKREEFSFEISPHYDALTYSFLQARKVKHCYFLFSISFSPIVLSRFRINFADPATTRPGSLAKSAVLAALEEDEAAQNGGFKPGE
jgi:hypothetical protein